MSVCCECCVLSGRGLCDELITHPEEFYRLWCIVVCDLETSRMRRQWPALGCNATGKKKKGILYYKVWNTHTHIYMYVALNMYVYIYICTYVYTLKYKCGKTPYTNFVRW